MEDFLSSLKSKKYGPLAIEVIDFYVPLALHIPDLRQEPELMKYTVKAIGREGAEDVATQVDTFIQKELKEKVESRHPEWQFWGEEGSDNTNEYDSRKEFLFITDPIEGTNNFRAKNNDLWGSVVALVDIKEKQPVIGIVSHPPSGTFYLGVKDFGAYILSYDEKGVLGKVEKMDNKLTLGYEGFTYNDSPHFSETLKHQVDLFLEAIKATENEFIDPESGALEVIRNRGTIYFKTSNEMAAVFVIVREMGGHISDGNGNGWTLGINSLISAKTLEDFKYLSNIYKQVAV